MLGTGHWCCRVEASGSHQHRWRFLPGMYQRGCAGRRHGGLSDSLWKRFVDEIGKFEYRNSMTWDWEIGIQKCEWNPKIQDRSGKLVTQRMRTMIQGWPRRPVSLWSVKWPVTGAAGSHHVPIDSNMFQYPEGLEWIGPKLAPQDKLEDTLLLFASWLFILP